MTIVRTRSHDWSGLVIACGRSVQHYSTFSVQHSDICILPISNTLFHLLHIIIEGSYMYITKIARQKKSTTRAPSPTSLAYLHAISLWGAWRLQTVWPRRKS